MLITGLLSDSELFFMKYIWFQMADDRHSVSDGVKSISIAELSSNNDVRCLSYLPISFSVLFS